MKRIVVIGAGGHAKVILEMLLENQGFEIAGFVDNRSELAGTKILGIPVLGDDSQLVKLFGQGVKCAIVGVGATGSTKLRQSLYEAAKKIGFEFATVVHPRSIVSPNTQIGAGTVVAAGAIINTGARIGVNVIVNTGSVIEHDCVIGDHAHVATGALLAGGVTIGEGAHVGIGACVKQAIKIGQNAIVGAGAVVVDDVAEGLTVAGNPARVLKGAN